MEQEENLHLTDSESADKTRKRTRKTALVGSLYDQGRIPPQALDLEEAVLGALMIEQNALASVVDVLKPEVFYKETHKIIYESIISLFKKAQPIDILTVTNELRSMGKLEIVGGAFYISQLTNRIASSANIEFHSRILLQKYMQRELIRLSSDIIRDSYDETTDVFELLDKAEGNLFSISDNNLRRDYRGMHSLVREAIKDIEETMKSEGKLRGVPSGFTNLDRVTSGWQKSDLIVIAARPGMGKTAFVLTMARNIAVDLGKPVAYFSLEMSSVQLVTRLIASETAIPSDKLKKGNLDKDDWEQLNHKITKLSGSPLFIDDTPALTIFELRAKCRRLKAQYNIELVVIDYIQLMSASSENKGNTNREQEISTISRSLKGLAKELNIPVITLSQLNRSVEQRTGSKRPILSDLRESGAIEQDADLVMFIYRPEYYKITEDENHQSTRGMAEIIVAKHRNGALRDVKLRFIENFAKFEDYDDMEYAGDDNISAIDHDQDYQRGSYTVPSKMNYMKDDEYPF